MKLFSSKSVNVKQIYIISTSLPIKIESKRDACLHSCAARTGSLSVVSHNEMSYVICHCTTYIIAPHELVLHVSLQFTFPSVVAVARPAGGKTPRGITSLTSASESLSALIKLHVNVSTPLAFGFT